MDVMGLENTGCTGGQLDSMLLWLIDGCGESKASEYWK
jgi:hypothetical protein